MKTYAKRNPEKDRTIPITAFAAIHGTTAVSSPPRAEEMNMTYTLIMINRQGASEETRNHPSKADVRRKIRTWDAKEMTARVYIRDGFCIYDGPALSF